ncbi:MAG: CoA-binding protein [Syntrophales bacterium]|nr:CoA-binding protein [Syntrophales bacterium]
MSDSDLSYFFQPRSIALVGASSDLTKPGGRCLNALLKRGFPGKIFPVNKQYGELRGLTCYASLIEVPGDVDMVIISVPAQGVLSVLDEAGRKGVKVAVIFTSGFAEIGPEGRKLQEELREKAKILNIRLLGPNCVGIVNLPLSVMASFANIVDIEPVHPMTLGFITQSGAFGAMIYSQAVEEGVGFSSFVSVGNEADTEFADFLEYMVRYHRETEIIGGYLEGAKDGRKLRYAALQALERGKPILMIKLGKTKAGARAAYSHTGSIAGEDAIYDAFFRQVGIIRIESLKELTSFVEVHRARRLPRGRRVAVLSVSGGAGVFMADKLEEWGLEVPEMEEKTRRQIARFLPPFGSAANPVDMTSVLGSDPHMLGKCLRALVMDHSFDMIAVNTALTDFSASVISRDIIDVYTATEKLIVVTVHVFHPTDQTKEAISKMKEMGIPVLDDHLHAVRAMKNLAWYAEKRRRFTATLDS